VDFLDQRKIGSWIIEVDTKKTKDFYEQYHLITEGCECNYCANYVLACDQLPEEIKILFNSLGIDPRKEGEVSEYMKNEDGTHLYGVFYHVVGRIIKGPQLWVPNMESSEVFSPNFEKYFDVEIGFSDEISLVPEGFPTPIIQFEVQMNVPWVLTCDC